MSAIAAPADQTTPLLGDQHKQQKQDDASASAPDQSTPLLAATATGDQAADATTSARPLDAGATTSTASAVAPTASGKKSGSSPDVGANTSTASAVAPARSAVAPPPTSMFGQATGALSGAAAAAAGAAGHAVASVTGSSGAAGSSTDPVDPGRVLQDTPKTIGDWEFVTEGVKAKCSSMTELKAIIEGCDVENMIRLETLLDRLFKFLDQKPPATNQESELTSKISWLKVDELVMTASCRGKQTCALRALDIAEKLATKEEFEVDDMEALNDLKSWTTKDNRKPMVVYTKQKELCEYVEKESGWRVLRLKANVRTPKELEPKNFPCFACMDFINPVAGAPVLHFSIFGVATKIATDIGGQQPIHFAASQGLVKLVDRLIEFKARPSVVSDRGATPLHKAASCGHSLIVKALLKAAENDTTLVLRLDEKARKREEHTQQRAKPEDRVTALVRMHSHASRDEDFATGDTALHRAVMGNATGQPPIMLPTEHKTLMEHTREARKKHFDDNQWILFENVDFKGAKDEKTKAKVYHDAADLQECKNYCMDHRQSHCGFVVTQKKGFVPIPGAARGEADMCYYRDAFENKEQLIKLREIPTSDGSGHRIGNSAEAIKLLNDKPFDIYKETGTDLWIRPDHHEFFADDGRIAQQTYIAYGGENAAMLHGETTKNVITLLLEARANLESSSEPLRWTPLHAAASKGAVESVDLLLKARANPYARDRYQNPDIMKRMEDECGSIPAHLVRSVMGMSQLPDAKKELAKAKLPKEDLDKVISLKRQLIMSRREPLLVAQQSKHERVEWAIDPVKWEPDSRGFPTMPVYKMPEKKSSKAKKTGSPSRPSSSRAIADSSAIPGASSLALADQASASQDVPSVSLGSPAPDGDSRGAIPKNRFDEVIRLIKTAKKVQEHVVAHEAWIKKHLGEEVSGTVAGPGTPWLKSDHDGAMASEGMGRAWNSVASMGDDDGRASRVSFASQGAVTTPPESRENTAASGQGLPRPQSQAKPGAPDLLTGPRSDDPAGASSTAIPAAAGKTPAAVAGAGVGGLN